MDFLHSWAVVLPKFSGTVSYKNGRVKTYQKGQALLPVDLRRPKMFLLNFLMSHWFESWHRRHIVWVESVVIFLLCSSESFVCLFVCFVLSKGGGGVLPYSLHLKNQHSKILFDLQTNYLAKIKGPKVYQILNYQVSASPNKVSLFFQLFDVRNR